MAKGVSRICQDSCHHRGHDQPAWVGEPYQLGLTVGSVETTFTVSLSVFLITWGQFQ